MQNYVVNDTLDLQITLPIASKRKAGRLDCDWPESGWSVHPDNRTTRMSDFMQHLDQASGDR